MQPDELPPPNPADLYVSRDLFNIGSSWSKKYPLRIFLLSFFAALLLFLAAAIFAGAINGGTTVPQMILGDGAIGIPAALMIRWIIHDLRIRNSGRPAPAGWYRDPLRVHYVRWFDGTSWTNRGSDHPNDRFHKGHYRPVTTQPPLSPAGWYPDPAGTGRWRYFNGSDWTANYSGPPQTA